MIDDLTKVVPSPATTEASIETAKLAGDLTSYWLAASETISDLYEGYRQLKLSLVSKSASISLKNLLDRYDDYQACCFIKLLFLRQSIDLKG